MNDDTDETFDEMMRNAELDARLARLSARADRSRPAPTSAAPASSGSKRRSAARGSRRVALGMSAVTTVGLAGWMYSAAGVTATNLSSISATSDTTATVAAATTATTAAATTATTAAAKTGSSSTLKDGTYTGSSVSTRFGPVQVRITVSGGTITAVTVPAYPQNDNRSAQINATAVPKLVSATLTAQSASVSNVSGATYTTNGYRTSLQNAIDAARA